jgi:hypothetical protein
MRLERFPHIAALEFEATDKPAEAWTIPIRDDLHTFLFYPVYHIDEQRWAWGNPVTYSRKYAGRLSGALQEMRRDFRPGGAFRITFSLGLAIAFIDPRTGHKTTLRLEGGNVLDGGDFPYDYSKPVRRLEVLRETSDLKSDLSAVRWFHRRFRDPDAMFTSRDELVLHGRTTRQLWQTRLRRFEPGEIAYFGDILSSNALYRFVTQAEFPSAPSLRIVGRAGLPATRRWLKVMRPEAETSAYHTTKFD